MKNVLNIVTSVTKKLLVAALALATLSPFTLNAMERSDNFTEDSKKQKTEAAQKYVTLICDDDTILPVRFDILQSGTIKGVIDDLGSIPKHAIPIAGFISSNTMRTMIHYMDMINTMKNKKLSKEEIIEELIKSIKPLDNQILMNCLVAAEYLDFALFYRSCYCVIAQKLHTYLTITEFSNATETYGDDAYFYIRKAHAILYNTQLEPTDPVDLTLHDLIDYGLLDDDVVCCNRIDEYIVNLITTLEFDRLQKVLDVLTKRATPPSIKAHHALVNYVKKLDQDQIKELFGKLQGESTLKMALRLVCAETYKANLDHLKCVYSTPVVFLTGNKLLSQEYIQYMLPLIEPLYGLITTLNLSFKGLTSLPHEIGNLVNLKELCLSHNKLTSLPNEIGNLTNLEILVLHSNDLTSLPHEIGNLVNLKELCLSYNKLTSLPNEIGNLRNLTKLELYNNELTSLPNEIGNLVNLKEFYLPGNQLTSLPNEIGNLFNLTKLNLENNKLTILPNSFGDLPNLKELNLDRNQLSSLPGSIGNLSSLKNLSLLNNKLTCLPNEIANLFNLERLDIRMNQLTDEIKQKIGKQFEHINRFGI